MVYSGTRDIPSKCEPNLGVLGDAAVVTAEEWTPCWRWTIRIYSALAAAALATAAALAAITFALTTTARCAMPPSPGLAQVDPSRLEVVG